jgi:hypothetical protein
MIINTALTNISNQHVDSPSSFETLWRPAMNNLRTALADTVWVAGSGCFGHSGMAQTKQRHENTNEAMSETTERIGVRTAALVDEAGEHMSKEP